MIKEIIELKIREMFSQCDVDINLIDDWENERLKRCINSIEQIIKFAYSEQHRGDIENIKKDIDVKIDNMFSKIQDDIVSEGVHEEIISELIKSSLNDSVKRIDK